MIQVLTVKGVGIGHMGAADQGADASSGRWMTIPRTLCFITSGDDVLLIKRAAHKRVFPGRYNGIGGHLERDEDPRSGAIREMREETGLPVRDVRLRAYPTLTPGSVGISCSLYGGVGLAGACRLRRRDAQWSRLPMRRICRSSKIRSFRLVRH
jgi:8-oxo-dGTP pyrophosphatase MutT (NUDIX family)